MKRFKKVYIEITNRCNLSCSFCPKTKRSLKRNNQEDFLHIIEAVKNHTDHVYLHLLGEPTLHPELKTYLTMCEEYGLKVNLTTNGTLLSKVKEVLITSPALRQVNISLHSFEANESSVEMNQYIESVLSFVEEATEKSNLICSLRLWNMDTEHLKAQNSLNTDIISLIEARLGIEFDIEEALSQKEGIKLKKNVYLNKAEKFEWPDHDREVIAEEIFCYGLRDQIGILVDGTVVPCCLDGEGHIALGNIFEQSLEKILESPRSKRLYEGFSNRRAVEELCKRCGYAMRYGKK
ncbi:MAG: radical SAM protein [Cellulosilyticum sp.]|nr:radical SAM protein [Cellulosilyticum sp.]